MLTLTAVRRSSERLRVELAAVEARIQEATQADVLAPLVEPATWRQSGRGTTYNSVGPRSARS